MGFKNSILDQWNINFEITDVDKSLDDLHGINVEYEVVEPTTEKATSRKGMPVSSGVLAYFPNALKEVSKVSVAGAEQHGQTRETMHWDRTKSTDNLDALSRHLIDHLQNPIDDDNQLHLAKVAWRALAALEVYLESK